MTDETRGIDKAAINRLVEGFRSNLRDLRESQTAEAVIRSEYLDEFWKALGWDVNNTSHRSPAEKDVVVEAHVSTIETERVRSRRPDYLFRIGGFPRFVVEAKKPGDLRRDTEAIFQAKTYAWSAQIPFAILTSFEEFMLFDATLQPRKDRPERGIIADFDLRFEDYVQQWDVLCETFDRQSVQDGSLERLLAKIKGVRASRRIRGIDQMLIDLRGSEPVDRVFLEHLQAYRLRFARDLYLQNRSAFPQADTHHGAARLTEATQRLIDRLVFLRVCEDRDITHYGEVRDTVNRAAENREDLWTELVHLFRQQDAAFNGYLFKPHALSESLTVSAELLADFIRSLYTPDGPYRFDAIGDDILGIIYERFLGSTITVRKTHVDAEDKPEVRHAGGVHYTPRFVVDSIVRRVVGPKIKGKSPLEVLNVKILDMAVGSGSFLIGAYQYLIDHCLAYINANPQAATVEERPTPRSKARRVRIAFRGDAGQWHLAPTFRGRLLTSCIHGVDIDAQAVEVTIMSLYLKLLEGKLPKDWQREWLDERLLPPMDNNIRCGNSLLSQTDFDNYWDWKYGSLFAADPDVCFRINAFDWNSQTKGFGRVLGDGNNYRGFDCIIGNPPYIRVQELNNWAPEECEFYKWRYKSAAKGNYDIYCPFIERGLELLAKNGLLGYICPHKFWQAAYGVGIRKLLASGNNLNEVIDFGDQQVFAGATTYTAIHIFSKHPNVGTIDYVRINQLTDADAQCRAIEHDRTPEGVVRFAATKPPLVGPWRFESLRQKRMNAALVANTGLTLKDVADRLFQGIRTSMNEVYALGLIDKKRGVYQSRALGQTVELEADLLHPFLGGDDIRRYEIRESQHAVLIPYDLKTRGKIRLISAKQMAKDYPLSWKYLRRCESMLRNRENGRMDQEGWYGFIYPKNLDFFNMPRIVVRDIVEEASFALDQKGEFTFVSGYGITLKPDYTSILLYVLGLLNSHLLDSYLRQVSTTLRGGWFRTFPQFLRQLPIKLPTTSSEELMVEEITERVRQIIGGKKGLSAK